MFEFAATTRLKRSPFYEATVAAGVRAFTTYNSMLMPAGYGDQEAEYWRLINGVTQWDVAAQRQVELRGPDAARLAQVLSTRDLSQCAVGQGKYVALCNHAGTLINDPILLKVAEEQFWLSIADSNILFWARAIAAERKFNVQINEVDVSPLAVQGPQAGAVVASIFGDWTQKLKHFWFQRADISGIPLLLARSGWSKQGGFELYLLDGAKGSALWNLVAEAGRPWDIGPCYPNAMERVESGLLSWGADTDDATNPFEVRLEKYVDLDLGDDVIGMSALQKIHRAGIARQQVGLILAGETPAPPHERWHPVQVNGDAVGFMTCGTWSPRLQRNIGFGLLDRAINYGDAVRVMKNGVATPATVKALPFV